MSFDKGSEPTEVRAKYVNHNQSLENLNVVRVTKIGFMSGRDDEAYLLVDLIKRFHFILDNPRDTN